MSASPGLLLSCSSSCPETLPWGLWCGQVRGGQVPREWRYVSFLRPPWLLLGEFLQRAGDNRDWSSPSVRKGAAVGSTSMCLFSQSVQVFRVSTCASICALPGEEQGASIVDPMRSDMGPFPGPLSPTLFLRHLLQTSSFIFFISWSHAFLVLCILWLFKKIFYFRFGHLKKTCLHPTPDSFVELPKDHGLSRWKF